MSLHLRAAQTATTLAAALFLTLVGPAVGQNVVSDLPLGDGGKERIVFTSPANPAAVLVMFSGGDGTVEIADTGTIYRYGGNFLMRTRPLWLAQGFAVGILVRPITLRSTNSGIPTPMPMRSAAPSNSLEPKSACPSGLSAPALERWALPMAPPISRVRWRVWC